MVDAPVPTEFRLALARMSPASAFVCMHWLEADPQSITKLIALLTIYSMRRPGHE